MRPIFLLINSERESTFKSGYGCTNRSAKVGIGATDRTAYGYTDRSAKARISATGETFESGYGCTDRSGLVLVLGASPCYQRFSIDTLKDSFLDSSESFRVSAVSVFAACLLGGEWNRSPQLFDLKVRAVVRPTTGANRQLWSNVLRRRKTNFSTLPSTRVSHRRPLHNNKCVYVLRVGARVHVSTAALLRTGGEGIPP